MSEHALALASLAAVVSMPFAAQTQTKPAIPVAFETRYCEACHAVDKKMVGPSLKDIAAKHKDKPDAVDYLNAKIKGGGQGVWGNVPMPASAAATDAEIAELTE